MLLEVGHSRLVVCWPKVETVRDEGKSSVGTEKTFIHDSCEQEFVELFGFSNGG